MRLIGLMPARNEEYALGLSLRAALMWCDAVVVLDHASTDRTREILMDIDKEQPGRIQIMTEQSPGWNEMEHRQSMLRSAREVWHATHIAIVDADEILTGFPLIPVQPAGANGVQSGIRQLIERIGAHQILHLPGYNLRGNICRYHSSGIWGERWFSTAFQDDPRLSWTGDRFHHREPMGVSLKPYKPIAQHHGGIMHLWGASERRLRAKSALYKITERLRWPDKPIAEINEMYGWAIYGRPRVPGDKPTEWQYRTVPADWWAPYGHLMKHLHLDAEPWQEAEVRRLVSEHPSVAQGLDLFGLA